MSRYGRSSQSRSFQGMNRRTFLATATAASAGALLGSRLSWAADDHRIEKIGVQLYTVRDLIPRLKSAQAQGIVEYPLNKIVM